MIFDNAGMPFARDSLIVQPVIPHRLRRFNGLDVEVDDHRILPTPQQDAFQRLIRSGVNFLVRYIGWHVDKIAWTRLGNIFEPIAPAHASAAFDDVNDTFDFAMMMGTGLGVGFYRDGSRPNFFGARRGGRDGSRPAHARGLRRVGIPFVDRNDAYAFGFPVFLHI